MALHSSFFGESCPPQSEACRIIKVSPHFSLSIHRRSDVLTVSTHSLSTAFPKRKAEFIGTPLVLLLGIRDSPLLGSESSSSQPYFLASDFLVARITIFDHGLENVSWGLFLTLPFSLLESLTLPGNIFRPVCRVSVRPRWFKKATYFFLRPPQRTSPTCRGSLFPPVPSPSSNPPAPIGHPRVDLLSSRNSPRDHR